MKIVIAVHHFLPRYTGGSEQHAYRIATELRARGHQVRVVCVERIDSGPAAGVAWEDEVFRGIPVRRLSFDRTLVPDPVRWEYDNPWIGDHLRTFLQADTPHVFQLIGGYLHTGRVLGIARELGVPTVALLTDYWFLCPRLTLLRSNGERSSPPVEPVTCARCLAEERRRYRLPGLVAPRLMERFWQRQHSRIDAVRRRQAFQQETLRHVDALVAPSQFLRDTFVAAGCDPARLHLCRQGLDLPAAKPRAADRPWSPPLRIGYVGQVVWHKGVHVAIAALRRLPYAPATLTIHGNTNAVPAYTAYLQRLAEDDPRIHFAGVYRTTEERRLALASCDVIVVPSLWYENNPMAILEALGHGVPVLTANLGSMPELVDDGRNGLLFAPGNAESLAQRIQQLLREPSLLSTLRASIGAVRSVADEVDDFERLYRRIAAADHPREAETGS